VQSVRSGTLNLFRASKEFGIPRNTLRARVYGDESKKPYQKESILGNNNEQLLAERIIHFQKLGFGLTIRDVRQMAFQFAKRNSIDNKFNEENSSAGRDWFLAFMRRHPQLSLRQAQGISYARAECMNKPMVHAFFDLYEKEADTLSLRCSPQSIYNADETGLQLHLRPGKVIAEKGVKSVLQVTNSERGEAVTVLACCSAVVT